MIRRKKFDIPTGPPKTGTLTCPKCKHTQQLLIPNDRCVHFYTCGGCKQLVECKECCVFCDYGDMPCPAGAAIPKD